MGEQKKYLNKCRLPLLLLLLGIGLCIAVGAPTWIQYSGLQELDREWQVFLQSTVEEKNDLPQIGEALSKKNSTKIKKLSIPQLDALIQASQKRTVLLFVISFFTVGLLVLLARKIAFCWIHEVREQLRILHFLQEETNEGWWDWKIPENYEYMSPRFWKTFGYNYKEMRAEPSEWMNIMHPEDKDLALAAFERHAKSFGKEPYRIEARYKHRDGHWVVVLCRGRIIEWDRESRPLRMVGTHTDISKLKEVQGELEQVNERVSLDVKLSTLGQIAGNIAHEINNPIAIAIGAAQLIEAKLAKETFDKEKVLELSQYMTSSLKRACDIVNGLKSLSANGKQYAFDDFLLNDAIEEIRALVETKCRLHEVAFNVVCDKDLIVYASKVQVSQVLANLVNNAFDAVKTLNFREIEIRAEELEGELSVGVYDSGDGPSIETQKKMMEPFFTTKAHGEGTGMGLSLSREIMERHGGSLSYSPDSGRSCFVLIFPKKKKNNNVA